MLPLRAAAKRARAVTPATAGFGVTVIQPSAEQLVTLPEASTATCVTDPVIRHPPHPLSSLAHCAP